MADYLVTDTELTSIANAIRTKGGTSANLSFPTEFVSAINAIPEPSDPATIEELSVTPSESPQTFNGFDLICDITGTLSYSQDTKTVECPIGNNVDLVDGGTYYISGTLTGTGITITYDDYFELTWRATGHNYYYILPATITGSNASQVYATELYYNPGTGKTLMLCVYTSSSYRKTLTASNLSISGKAIDGYLPVAVSAIDPSYVGSGVTRRSSSDLTISGTTVTAPAGYYENQASINVPGAPTLITKNITQNGTYNASSDNADGYSSVIVNVGGGSGGSKWVRPSDWPDLSAMDVSGGDIIYMTSYADEVRGFCSIYIFCTGSYTVEVGSISGSVFTAESTHTVASGNRCNLYYGEANGTYKVLRVTGTGITSFRLGGYNSAITIGTFKGYTCNAGIIDVVGKLPSCSGMDHSNCYNLVNMEIDGVSLQGSMYNMFQYCISLASLDVSGWNTSAVTNMNGTFSYCYSLTSLDLSGWNTSAVTTMGNMFSYCASLASLNVSGWNTSAVTNMNSMFYACYSLTSLDVSGWNTEKVTSLSSMFYACYSLTSLDVSGWNTEKVTGMSGTFGYCYSLTSLDVSGWNTSAVTNMNSMFSYCASLTSLDVSEWNTGLVTGTGSMFTYCTSLTSLDVSGWNTEKVTTMSSMFSYCTSLTSLDVSEWNTSAVTNINSMFCACYSLTSLDLSGWNTEKVTSMSGTFSYCYSLTSLDLSGWSTSAVTNISSMFVYCRALTSIDISGWDLAKCTSASNTAQVFRYCSGLHGSITIPASMTQIGAYFLADTLGLYEYHFLSTTPPTLANSSFSNMTDYGGKEIYVPAASLSAYQTASNWSRYASQMIGE